ncbi:MAG: serine/threonine protein kinase [Gammaproteobacteria bacterium]|nr:serine/threonine protein kinase [Gammaproteobacteria bacterium]MDH3536832.1 serine/threonine protein kinase [Gammaproteobacteria bacterium]
MAVLGSILFNRTLRQFLDCKDLESEKGVALTQKLRNTAKDSLERLIQVIPETGRPHSDVLRDICLEHVEGSNEELFLKSLDNDATDIRSTAASILSRTAQVKPAKLFKKLHESDVSKTEIIDILAFQREKLKPEQIIVNALKLDKSHAEQLLKLAPESLIPLDLSALRIEPGSIGSPSIKIMLLRYFAQVEQPEVAQVIAKFLTDNNKTIVIEALKSLKNLRVKFDASVLLPFVESMSEVEREMAIEILRAQADEELVSRLAPWTCGKSDDIRETFIKLLVKYVTPEGLEAYLRLLDKQEWWGKDQSLKCLQKFGNDKLYTAAETLVDHENDFIREQAQRFAAHSSDPSDLKKLWDNALHDDWQVRESAIEAIGRSGKRESIGILKKVVERWSESTPSVLKAVAELGFSKGLEIAFACLRMPEALVQREALETIGKLATKRHARTIRDKLMQKVPQLQATVRDTAGEVVNRLTEEYELPQLNVDQEAYFDTRLLKFDTQTVGQGSTHAQEEAAVPAPQFQNIEELKQGDLWMDRFRIDREIGRGAMGRVMLARDEMVGEAVILKFMHPELTSEESSRERFLREVKYSRKVSHPNVIRIHDMLFKDNLSAISMEYFESRGLDDYLREKKRFDVKEALDILFQVANGMAAAHHQDVIHRDLKPSNILMNDTGLVKIVDFGIASASSNSDVTLTKTGSIIGTPAYLSPERAKGFDADHRSDVYALGIIAYCMFAGRLPYTGEPMSLLFQHLEGKAVPLHLVREALGPRVSMLVQKMMAVELEDRLQTMEDVADAIRDVQHKER